MSDPGVTRAESCVIACADVWRDAGEVMVSPFGTIPALGARLAKLTFSPDISLTDGEAALMVPSPPVPPSSSARRTCPTGASSTSCGPAGAT
jgi:acyl CoA:acetate/3-ketoacid CoA transferase beta subunit